MSDKIETLTLEDEARLEKHREWMIGHFDEPSQYQSVAGKLRLIQAILDNKWVKPDETWKLQSLGVTFGDALVQEVAELFWVAVEDEYGRDPALRWLETSILTFPLTAISKRVEDGVIVDVFEMFGRFQKAIHQALRNEA